MDKRRLGRPVLTEAGVAARVTNAAEGRRHPGWRSGAAAAASIGSLHLRTATPCGGRVELRGFGAFT
jgi:hypothetical protein